MDKRIDYWRVARDGYRALLGVDRYVYDSGLERPLLELVKLRASQINGCAYCLDMHWKDAVAAGETEQRLYSLSAWREAPFYTDRERAALAWTEALTLISQTHAPDETFAEVRAQFSEKETVDLTLAIAQINTWNRLSISMRAPEAGSYDASRRHTPAPEPPTKAMAGD